MTKSAANQKAYVQHIGAPYRFANEVLILAPLTLGQLEQFTAESEEYKGNTDFKAHLDYSARVVHASLVRNYPDITFDRVRNELLDAWNLGELVNIVMSKSGLVAAPTDEVLTVEKFRELTEQYTAR